MIDGAVVNILDFGADPTGLSDSLVAINAAFLAGSCVYFPTGTYLVSGSVQVPNNKSFFGDGRSSVIRGNFANAVLKIGELGSFARSENSSGRDLLVSSGALSTIGVQFEGVVKSNYENLYVQADDDFNASFTAFRFGGEIYSNNFIGLKARSISQNPSSNGIGFHLGNQFNEWGTLFASCNDNVFVGCVSNPFNVGFFVDSAQGNNFYGCNAEKGASFGLIFAGGQTNFAYNFWNENNGGVLFTRSYQQDGSGGFAYQSALRNALVDVPRFGINVVMEYTQFGRVANTILQGVCTIASTSEYCVWENVTIAGGASITDNGLATHLEYRENGYTDYNFTYSTGAAQAQGARLRANGASVSLTNLFNNQFIQIPAFSAEAILGASNWRSSGDNLYSLGTSGNRWSVVYAGTGTINTSDEREKTFLIIEDAERMAALEIKTNLRKFKFNDAIEKKGNDARIHFGVAAQQVGSIMESHGLDPNKYGFFCYDEWEQTVDENGDVTLEAGNRYGIRYEELLCFIISAT